MSLPNHVKQLSLARQHTPLDLLQASPEEVNPALLMAWELKRRELAAPLDVLDLLPLAGEIEAAVNAGQEMVNETDQALKRLKAAPGVPSPQAPTGF